MKILSLFDGVSCGRIALERAKIPVEKYYASEIDKYAIQVSNNNYPDIIRLGDITKIDFTKLKDIDLIIGGSPCQDLSIANNNRQGLLGSRSSLFWKFVEAVNVIKPKYFLLENVASMNNQDKKIISEALGVEPVLIDSALLSAQHRKRLYWCNWKVEQPKEKQIYLKDIMEKDFNFNDFMVGNLFNKRFFNEKTGTIGTQNGRVSKQGLSVYKKNDFNNFIRKLTPIEYERLQTLKDNYTLGLSNTQRYKCIGNGWTVDIITHIFNELKKNNSKKNYFKNLINKLFN